MSFDTGVKADQAAGRAWPERLPDLAVGEGDVFYDKATDRLKVVVRFETSDGALLAERVIARLEAPLDLRPKTAVVWLPQPTFHPVDRIVIRIDPDGRLEEITKENNHGTWRR